MRYKKLTSKRSHSEASSDPYLTDVPVPEITIPTYLFPDHDDAVYINPEYDPAKDLKQPFSPVKSPSEPERPHNYYEGGQESLNRIHHRSPLTPEENHRDILEPPAIAVDADDEQPHFHDNSTIDPSELYPPDYGSNMDCDQEPLADPKVRFLNAAPGYGSFKVSIGSKVFEEDLRYGQFTEFDVHSVEPGYRTVTVVHNDELETIVYQGAVPFMQGEEITLAVTVSEFGIDLVTAIENMTCPADNAASVRFVNLCYGSPPLDIILTDRRVIFTDVSYKVATQYRRFKEGHYDYFLAFEAEPTGSYLLCELIASAAADFKEGKVYTMYIIGRISEPETLSILACEME